MNQNWLGRMNLIIHHIKPIDRLVQNIADMIVPIKGVYASCYGCTSVHCGWYCHSDTGEVSEMFKELIEVTNCQQYICRLKCSAPTSITC